ncbi:hypothetical protein [uncultured Tolumonas sp.]|uniref:hypothetical protein n=1 Tax=uncultured Tolumonas sp. TaxID=263765 RepID=UPI002A0A5ECB|nr:hypothetical protein [uncultured Tolumonas sp.]
MIELLIKLLDWVLFPFKNRVTSFIAKWFLNVHVRSILRECDSIFNISSEMSPLDLINQRAFRGLIREYVQSDYFLPNVKDIAVSINLSCDHYLNGTPAHESNIIDLAYHICSELKRRIALDSSLRSTFINLDKSASDINNKISREEISNIFNSKKSLFTDYFTTFSDDRYNYSVKIWHQSESTPWLDWDNEHTLVVKLNPVRIREGFFLIGFDYTEISTGYSLKVASEIRGYEYFNNCYGNIVWAR